MAKLVDDDDVLERPRLTEEDLRQWAARMNQHPFVIGQGWWFVVRKRPEGVGWYTDKLEGWRATEARDHARGVKTQWYRGTQADMAAIHAYVRRCLGAGMTQAEFNEHVRRTGGCPRPD